MPTKRTKKSLSKKRLTKQVRRRGKKSRRSRSKRKYNLKGGSSKSKQLSDFIYDYLIKRAGGVYNFRDSVQFINGVATKNDGKRVDWYMPTEPSTGIDYKFSNHRVLKQRQSVNQGQSVVDLESTIKIAKYGEDHKLGFFPHRVDNDFKLYFTLGKHTYTSEAGGSQWSGADTPQKVLMSGGKILSVSIIDTTKITTEEIDLANPQINENTITGPIKNLNTGQIIFKVRRENINLHIDETEKNLNFSIQDCLIEPKIESPGIESPGIEINDETLNVTFALEKLTAEHSLEFGSQNRFNNVEV